MKPIFITGNADKAAYLAKHLGVPLDYLRLDLDEIQSTQLEEIVTHKVKQAYQKVGAPVLVEDVSLGFDALNGLPGPFIKFFVDAPDGLMKLCQMCNGLDNRNAVASCVYGYYDGTTIRLFKGSLHGTISDTPKGEGGYGWDKIFCPNGYSGRTRAELTPEEDEETYTVIKPYDQLRGFLATL